MFIKTITFIYDNFSSIWSCYQKICGQLVQLREWKFITHCQVTDALVEAEIKTVSQDRLTFKAKVLPSPTIVDRISPDGLVWAT